MNLHFWNVARACAKIDFLDAAPTIDLSRATFFSPFALVYLGMFVRYFSEKGVPLQLIVPDDFNARSYLARQNFWQRFNFDEKTVKTERLHRFTTSTSFNDIMDIERHDFIADEIGDKLMDVLANCDCQLPARKVALIVSELVDNFAQHSGKMLATLTLQYYPRKANLSVAIGDCGIGIRESLSSNHKYRALANDRHHVAVLEAFKAGVSRKREGGTGFTDILDGVSELGGQLRLATGDEYVIVRRRNVTVGDMAFDLPGVQIEVFLPERR